MTQLSAITEKLEAALHHFDCVGMALWKISGDEKQIAALDAVQHEGLMRLQEAQKMLDTQAGDRKALLS